jgi:type IV/VI secretion system ImpK/VasF family protein
MTAMARLLDAFSAFFAFGLRLAAARETGGAMTDPAAARQQAHALLDAARGAARAAGWSAARVESASFAAVAWFDELLQRLAGVGDAGDALQSTLFNSSNAQTEFFHHLAALGPDDDAVREVYWYALALGFRGQYYFEDADTGEWAKLKRLHGQQLPTPPVELDALAWTRLTPQPYASPDPPARRRPQRRRRALVRAAGAFALLAPSAYLISLLLGDRAGPPPAPAERVAAQLQRYACADLALATGPDGSAHVSGFVASSEDGARVRQDVAALPQTKTPDFDLRIRAWPYCEVAAILKPYQLRNQDSKAGLRIEAPSAPAGRLREGDAVRLQVTGPVYASHVRVDYFTADGAVLHLMSESARARLPARQTVTLGGNMPTSWLVSPPFGTVLVAVVASPAPFERLADRPPFELAPAYLAALRESIAANPGSQRLVADFLFLETTAR